MPAANAPHISARGVPRPVMTDAMSACAATPAASPVMSLSGRSAVNQKSGEHTTIPVAQNAGASPGGV
jgi:hypothetical protein